MRGRILALLLALAAAICLAGCAGVLQLKSTWTPVATTGFENFHGVLCLDLLSHPFKKETECIVKVRVSHDGQITTVMDSNAVYHPTKGGPYPAQLEIFGVEILRQIWPEKERFGPDDMDWLGQAIISVEVKRRRW